MSKPNGAVFALKAYSIKQHGGRFYVTPTACFTEKPRWSKRQLTSRKERAR